jgi:TolB-like protein/Tfp pilus assembly protein PilF
VLLGVIAVVAIAAAVYFALRPAAKEPAVAATPAKPAPPSPIANNPSPAAAPAAAAKSLAVLPFANMSSEKENEFFTDGIHEDILTNLALIRDVRVVSRTSVMQYRGTTKPISQIASELKVTYVLEGSVRRSGNKVRVTGQLIRAGTDEHLWAKAYDRDLTDVFTIQAELATAIAGALQSVLSPEAKSILDRKPTDIPAAYDLFLKARHVRYNGTFTEQHGIIALLEQAVGLDPKFAAAWGELGSRRAFEFFNMEHTDALLAKAKDAIDAAVRLAPDDPLVIEGQGDFYYYGYRDYARATEHYTRLAQLRPNDPAMFWSLALIQRRQGRFADARRNLLRAVELDPANRNYAAITLELLIFGRRYAEAEALARKWVQVWPEDLRLAWSLAVITYSANGATAEMTAFARRTVPAAQHAEHLYHQRVLALMRADWPEVMRLDGLQRHFDSEDDPTWEQDVTTAAALAEMGNLPAARERMREALTAMQAEETRQAANDVLWDNLAVAHAFLGNKEESMRCREKALALMPPSRDALQGAFNGALLAGALAWCGEKDRALAEFERLLHVPFGTNIYRDRGYWIGAWQPLRDDPRFQALLADPKNNGPLF